MTSLSVAWPGRMAAAPAVSNNMPAVPHVPPVPPANQPYVMHPPQPPPVVRISSPSYEPHFQSQQANKLESFVQESMSTINRNLEALKEDIRRQNDKDEKFDKLERLIKRTAIAILGAIAVHAALSWLRAERHMKTLTSNIAKLAASRIQVEQVLHLLS
jgi:hypothetical protein